MQFNCPIFCEQQLDFRSCLEKKLLLQSKIFSCSAFKVGRIIFLIVCYCRYLAEKGFSVLVDIKTKKRSCLLNETLDDLM